METELLAVFDDKLQKISENTREFIHKNGLWHETFHCWFVHIKEGVPYLYFQRRSEGKKDFPNLFDITAAGHILVHETVEDGIREVKEELGIDICMNDLHAIGIIRDRILQEAFMDNEFAHTYLYITENENPPFHIQTEELSGIFSSPLAEVEKLYKQEIDHISVKCLISNKDDLAEIKITLQDVVPHGIGYMSQVITSIQQKLGELAIVKC